jgi:hypothetical protein
VDIVTLGLRVNDDGTVKLKAFGDVSEQAARKIASLEDRLNKLTGAHTRASGAGEGHRLATGRVSRALEGLIVSTVGANAHLGVLGVTLSDFALGSGVVTGVLAGIGAIIFTYEKLTESTRKAREEQDKLIKALSDEIHLKSLGPGGSTVDQVAAANQRAADLKIQISQLEKEIRGPDSGFGRRAMLQHNVDNLYIERQNALNIAAGGQSIVNENVTQAIKEENREREAARNKATAERLEREKQFGAQAAIQAEVANQKRDAITDARKLSLVPETRIPDIQFVGLLSDAELKHAESVRKLDEEYKAAKEVFSSTDAAVENFREGVKQAATGLLDSLSPSNIAQGLAGGLIQKVDGFVSGVFSSITGGVRHALFGQDSEERAAKRAEVQAAKNVALSLDALAAQLAHNDLQAALDQLRIGLIATLSSIDASEPGKRNESQRNADRQRAIDLEQKSEAQARHQDQLNKQYAQEDLALRNLRATGQGDAADLLAFQEKQAREMQSALDSNKDATYINTLKIVEQNELLAFMNGLLSDAVRNAPTGFWANAYYQSYATPRGGDGLGGGVTGGGPDNSGGGLTPPGGRSGGSPQGRAGSISVTIPVILEGRVLTSVFVKNIDQYAASTGGAGTSRADALNRMPA